MDKVTFIFFDLDDTLYDAEAAYKRALLSSFKCFSNHEMVKEESKVLSWETYEKVYGQARSEVKALLVQSVASSHSRLLYFKKMTEIIFSRTCPSLALALDQSYSSEWSNCDFSQAIEALEFFKKAGFRMAIVTNHICYTQMEKLAVLDPGGKYFEWVLTSEEVGVEKPNIKIFETAISKSGVSANQITMVGDSWENDIVGALKCGMNAVYVDLKNSKKELNFKPTGNLKSIKELKEIVRVISGEC
ncbi:MAG: HAD family hydrolase [Bdellovibrionales bacterium]|nr:HAD family hydrolase [Bdellovibrionales bacterium]